MNGKWRKVTLLTLLMGTCFAAGAWASDGIEKVEAYLRPDFKVMVDGQPVNLDKPVLLYDDSSYLPLRKISEMLNADVKWEESSHSIYINTRFAGQPDAPASETGNYTEIRVAEPFPYKAGYLGSEYTLVSAMVGQIQYYRVDDLARMGVDTKGLTKSKDVNTGSLYVMAEDAIKVWKQTPELRYSMQAAVAGAQDTAQETFMLDMAQTSFPALASAGVNGFPKYLEIYLVDAVSGHPGWFCMYGRGNTNNLLLYMVNVDKKTDGKWFSQVDLYLCYHLTGSPYYALHIG